MRGSDRGLTAPLQPPKAARHHSAQAPVIRARAEKAAGFLSGREEGGSRRGVVMERNGFFSGVHPAVFMCREGRLVINKRISNNSHFFKEITYSQERLSEIDVCSTV